MRLILNSLLLLNSPFIWLCSRLFYPAQVFSHLALRSFSHTSTSACAVSRIADRRKKTRYYSFALFSMPYPRLCMKSKKEIGLVHPHHNGDGDDSGLRALRVASTNSCT